jgi:hypothetical protein
MFNRKTQVVLKIDSKSDSDDESVDISDSSENASKR